jgi:D-arabinose 1-dehydrogenase-like Zn-dependent alcohol dehydrogenase
VLPSPLARPGESERSQVNTCGLPITNRGKPGLRAGDLVAVQGIGGLGHLGVQFARHMGFHTVASVEGAKRKSLRKIWARTSISILPSTIPVPRQTQEHI